MEESGSAAFYPLTPEDHYRVVYVAAIDTIVGCIHECFEQEGYREYRKLEDILRNGDQGIDSDEVFHLYQDDLDRNLFNSQFSTFHVNFFTETNTGILNILEIVKKMSAAEKSLLPAVVKAVRILLVVPAIVKYLFLVCLRSTMLQKHLNALMLLHVHKDCIDNLDLKEIARDFIDKCDYRKNNFPKF